MRSMSEQERLISAPMRRALQLAGEAEMLGEVPVGAVIIHSETGQTLGEGFNHPIANHDPTAHAEIMAIRQAAKTLGNYRLSGHYIYVTLEPCTMCAGAISQARLSRLIFAARDQKGGAIVSGVRFFEQASCHSAPHIFEDALAGEIASRQLKAFFKKRRKRTN